MLGQITLAPSRITRSGVRADPRDGRVADHLLTEALLQSGLDVPDRDAPQEAADDQRLQRMRASDALAEQLTLEPHPARVPDPRTLNHRRATRSPNRARLLKPVAINHLPEAADALIPAPADELRDLVLERLLQDQPRTKTRDRLHRILDLADPGQDFISSRRNRSLGTNFFMRAYLHQLRLVGQSGGYVRPISPAPGTAPGGPCAMRRDQQYRQQLVDLGRNVPICALFGIMGERAALTAGRKGNRHCALTCVAPGQVVHLPVGSGRPLAIGAGASKGA